MTRRPTTGKPRAALAPAAAAGKAAPKTTAARKATSAAATRRRGTPPAPPALATGSGMGLLTADGARKNLMAGERGGFQRQAEPADGQVRTLCMGFGRKRTENAAGQTQRGSVG